MFQYRFDPLFTIQFQHPYYRDGLSRDFDFGIPPQTEELLKQYNLKIATSKGFLRVLCQKEIDATPVSPIDRPLDLFFAVRVNSDILNLTDLEGAPLKYLLSNLSADGTLKDKLTIGESLSGLDVLPPLKPQRLQFSWEPGLYRQIRIQSFESPAAASPILQKDISPQQYNLLLALNHPGRYRFAKIKTAGGEDVEESICHDGLSGLNHLWAVLHIRLDQTVDYTTAKEYRVLLPQKKAPWRYFVVLSNNKKSTFSTGVELSPAFSIQYPPLVNSPYPGTSIAHKPEVDWTPQEKATAEALMGSKIAKIYLFETAAPVPLFEQAPPQIKLVTPSGSDVDLILSAPVRDQYSTNIFVNL